MKLITNNLHVVLKDPVCVCVCIRLRPRVDLGRSEATGGVGLAGRG